MGLRVQHQVNCGESGYSARVARSSRGYRVIHVEVLIPSKPAYRRAGSVVVSFGCGQIWQVIDQPLRTGAHKFRRLKNANGEPLHVPSMGGLWVSARDAGGNDIPEPLIVANVVLETL